MMSAPIPSMGAPKPFNSSAPGSGAQTGGINAALQQLGNSLNASSSTTAGQQMALGNQLQQQQGGLQQSLQSRGLGNTSIANTMSQAPIQSYNLGMAQIGDLNAQRQMGAYQNLAGMYAQGGQQISQMDQPYAQSNYAMQVQNMMQQQQQAQHPQMVGGGNIPASVYQNLRLLAPANTGDNNTLGSGSFNAGTVHGTY